MTTRRFMLTPRLMSLYAFVDSQHIDDAGRTTDQFAQKNPAMTFTFQGSRPIPVENSVTAGDPDFMVFYNPKLASTLPPYDPLCPQDPIVYKTAPGFTPFGNALHFGALRGQTQSFQVTPTGSAVSHICNPPATASLYAAADFNTWQMVNIRTAGRD